MIILECSTGTHTYDDRSGDEFDSCFFACQVTIPAAMHAAVLVNCQAAGFMTNGTQDNVFERRCFTTVRGLMDILSGKPFYIYVIKMTPETVSLLKVVIHACAKSPQTCIIHVRDNEQNILPYK